MIVMMNAIPIVCHTVNGVARHSAVPINVAETVPPMNPSRGDDDHRIGDAVRQFVEDVARLRGHLPFDRDHAVEHVADQAKLNPDCRRNQQRDAIHTLGIPAGNERCARSDREDDAENGDRIRTHTPAHQHRRQRLRPTAVTRLERTTINLRAAIVLLTASSARHEEK
jgi:hypothetical protein